MDFLETPLDAPWLNVLAMLVAAIIGGLLGGAIVLRSWRRLQPETHWTERARVCFAAQAFLATAPAFALVYAAFYCGALRYFAHEPWLHLGALVFAAWLGAIIGSLPLRSRWRKRRVGLVEALEESGTTIVLRSLGTYVFLVMAAALVGHGFDLAAVIIMVVALGTVFVFVTHGGVPLLRFLGMLTPASPRIESIVRQVAERSGSLAPQAYTLRWSPANAMAFPFVFAVAVTPALEKILTDEELLAVISHEFEHLRETRAQKLTRLLGIPSLFCLFSSPVWMKEFGLAGLIMANAIVCVAARMLGRFSRQMETQADAQAKREHEDPKIYAGALEKLYEHNLVPAVHQGKHSHPNLYDRLLAVGFTPAYPRPKAPSRVANRFALIILIACLAASQFAVFRGMDAWASR